MRRSAHWQLAALSAAVLVLTARSARAGDPYLEWHTVHTPNFQVHYHGGLDEVAQRTATLAESINDRLAPHMGHRPSETTHIVLRDSTDTANGSASGVPYNAIDLYVTAPDDLSPLGDYDDWILSLLTHEHAHILHVDNIHGIPALVNAILGKTWAPNQVQPRWILEGIAVAVESRFTSGGRVRSPLFDMYLRADVLEDAMPGLDRMTHSTRRWPRGNVWYLYGGRFFAWIEETFGDGVIAAIATDYGQIPIGWGINRSLRRATGHTYPELYEAWKADLELEYRQLASRVRKRGLIEGTRLTHHGGEAYNPRFIPDCNGSGSGSALLYQRDDGHEVPGLYRLPLDARLAAREDDAEILIRTRSMASQASFTPDCDIVYDSTAFSRRRHWFPDLHLQPRGTASPFGLAPTFRRLTTGLRARDPDVSPDGRRIVFVTNHAGTTTLRIAEFTPSGDIVGIRALVESARYEQAFSPRWSPSGKYVAYSVWTEGGYRDVRVVNVESGEFWEIIHDRAMDMHPTWTPDGRSIIFSSDRSGIPNIYAFELQTRALRQVTNVINGALMPELSPDGRTLYYVGYTHEGFDLYGMPLDPARFLPAPPAYQRPSRPTEPEPRRWPITTYNPLVTLRPRNYDVEYGDGTFGKALILRVQGSDAVGLHSASLRGTYQTELEGITWSAGYRYSALPFAFNASLFRDVVPRGGVRVGERTENVRDTIFGVTTALSYPMPGAFDNQSVSLSYTLSTRDPNIPISDDVDPFARPTNLPFSGILSSVRLSYQYTATQRSAWSISAERGLSLSLAGDLAGRETGSEETLQAFTGRLSVYLPVPGLDHHVLASSIGAGASGGTYPSRGFFFTGGFTERDVIEDFQSGIRQGAFLLRGYEPAQFVGRRFALLNSEYRFPIWYADRGISTLPVFIRDITGTAYFDWGGAFDELDPDDPLSVLHPGLGAELRLGLVLGYALSGSLAWGLAQGLDDEAPDGPITYMVLNGSF